MDAAIFFLVCLASTSWALPQIGFPNSASIRGQAFSALPAQPRQWAIIPYSYGYEVQDPLTNNYQNKAEIKTANGDVYGSYSVLMPDGYIYTTTYNSTQTTGFVSRLVKTLAVLPQQLAALAAPQQVQQQVAPPQQFHLVNSQAQLPQQLQQVQLPQPQQAQPQQQQLHAHQFQPQQQLPQPQQLQPQQLPPQQQLPQQLPPQHLQNQQLLSLQQLPHHLQAQQLPTQLHGPFRVVV